MDLRQLKYFLTSVEHRSFGRAAEVLNVTQPALSKAVRRLELDLGVKLLDRLPRGVSPTIYGEALAAHAHLIGTEIDRARSAITELKAGNAGRVVVGAGSSMRIELLPVACVSVHRQAPGAEIKLVGALYDDLIPNLSRGELDLVLSMIPETPEDPELVHEPLYLDQNHPCVRPGHPLLASEQPVAAAAYLDYGWVLPAHDNLPRQYLNAYFHARRLPTPRAAIESNSSVFTMGVLERSDLIGWLPTQIIAAGQGEVVAVPDSRLALARTVGITYRKATALSPVAHLLIDELKATAADMIAAGTVMPMATSTADHDRKLSVKP